MTSPIFVCCFEKFLVYTLSLPSFIVVRPEMVELNGGGGGERGAFAPFVQYRCIPDPVQNRVKPGLRASESDWLKLGKNRRSQMKNQLKESSSTLNADKKWSKSFNDRMHSYGHFSCK